MIYYLDTSVVVALLVPDAHSLTLRSIETPLNTPIRKSIRSRRFKMAPVVLKTVGALQDFTDILAYVFDGAADG